MVMLRKFSSVLVVVLSCRLLKICTSDLHAGMICLMMLLSVCLLLTGVGLCSVKVVTGMVRIGFVDWV